MRTEQEIRDKIIQLSELKNIFNCTDVTKAILALRWVMGNEKIDLIKNRSPIVTATINALKRALDGKNWTLAELMEKTDVDLLELKGFGPGKIEWFRQHEQEVYNILFAWEMSKL